MSAAKILFAGTPVFALVALEALIQAGHMPVAVLTQPDRPAGRGKKLTASPVKTFAVGKDIPVWQPATLKDSHIVAEIAAIKPDIMIVAAYGLILPQAVLDIPRHGCLNVHASLLPRWRGAAPIQHAILDGDARTGVCLMQMDAGLDTGPVFVSAATEIGADETAGELHDRLASLGGELLVAELPGVLAGKRVAAVQDESLATYAGKIRKQDAAINWSETALQICRKIRAYNPAPGARCVLDGEHIKCWKAVDLAAADGPASVILQAGRDGIDIGCGGGVVRVLEVQRPGRRPITAREFATQQILTGKRLG